MRFRPLPMLALLLFGSPLAAHDLTLSSGNGQRVLPELYTSEGCSSCPAMERYLGSFRTHGVLWDGYIPVAFHVDYWDDIGWKDPGWKDPFAAPAFSTRQRQHASEGSLSSIYTPALLVNGRSWRPTLPNRLPRPNTPSAGTLDVSLDQEPLVADFKPLSGAAVGFDLHIALLGMGIDSPVTAGENKGKTLRHEFVVIGFRSLPDDDGHWETRLPELHYAPGEPRALAVWVSARGRLQPLQAVGGYLPDAALAKSVTVPD